MHCARAHADQSDQLVGVEAPRRLAEQQCKHALLSLCEEGIGKVGGRWRHFLDRTHFEHECTQVGCIRIVSEFKQRPAVVAHYHY